MQQESESFNFEGNFALDFASCKSHLSWNTEAAVWTFRPRNPRVARHVSERGQPCYWCSAQKSHNGQFWNEGSVTRKEKPDYLIVLILEMRTIWGMRSVGRSEIERPESTDLDFSVGAGDCLFHGGHQFLQRRPTHQVQLQALVEASVRTSSQNRLQQQTANNGQVELDRHTVLALRKPVSATQQAFDPAKETFHLPPPAVEHLNFHSAHFFGRDIR